MKLEIDSGQIIQKKIDLNDYFLLYCLYVNDLQEIRNYLKVNKISTESLDKLKSYGYICNSNIDQTKYSFDSISLTEKFKEDFVPKVKITEGVESWIDQWYDLFPKGVKTQAGYTIRTDKVDCTKKMIKFVKENPQYSKGVIIGATKKYLSVMASKNYSHCKLAPYLIYKDGLSILSGLCESFDSSTKEPDDYKEDRL